LGGVRTTTVMRGRRRAAGPSISTSHPYRVQVAAGVPPHLGGRGCGDFGFGPSGCLGPRGVGFDGISR
jgi:hypothetical protein